MQFIDQVRMGVLDQPQCSPTTKRYDIAQLTRKVRPSSYLYLWKEHRQKGVESATAESLLSILEQRTSDWADRAVGYHLLAGLPLSPSEQDLASRILVRALKEPNDERPTVTGASAKGVAAIYLGWYITFAGVCLLNGNFLLGLFAGFFFAGFTTLLTAPIVLAIQDQLRANTLQRVAANSLAQVGTPHCIGALYHYIRRPSIYRQEILQALRAVLPRVTADWYGQLPADSTAALTGLAGSSDEALALAALDALEQAGGGASVKAIERLAARCSIPRVRDRAAIVLPILVARRENEKSSASLLRPSALTGPEELVRPVYSSDLDVTNLLRASQAEIRSASPEETENRLSPNSVNTNSSL